MLITCPEKSRLYLPKTDRCLSDPCGVYTLILQNNYTKELTVRKVQEGLRARMFPNPLRFEFEVDITAPGEYTYYLCSFDAWSRWNLDSDIIERSYIDDHDIPMFGGVGITSDGFVLVEGRAAIITGAGEALEINGQVITGPTPGGPYGELYRKVRIICSGIISIDQTEEITEYETGYEHYIQP